MSEHDEFEYPDDNPYFFDSLPVEPLDPDEEFWDNFRKSILYYSPDGAVDVFEKRVQEVSERYLPLVFLVAASRGDLALSTRFFARMAGRPFSVQRKSPYSFKVTWELGEFTLPKDRLNSRTFAGTQKLQDVAQCLLSVYSLTGDDFSGDSALAELVFGDNYHNLTIKRDGKVYPGSSSLPELRDGALQNPGLVYGALDLAQNNYPAGWFEDILCWATPEMAALHPEDLVAYHSELNFVSRTDGRNDYRPLNTLHPESDHCEEGLTPAEWRQRSLNNLTHIYSNMTVSSEHHNKFDLLLFKRFVDSAVSQFGAGFREDRVLCKTTISFLKRFDLPAIDDEERKESARTLAEAFPLDIIYARSAAGADAVKGEHMIGTGYKVTELVEKVGELPLIADMLAERLPANVLDRVLELSADQPVTIPAYLKLSSRFDLSRKGATVLCRRQDSDAVYYDLGDFTFPAGIDLTFGKAVDCEGHELAVKRCQGATMDGMALDTPAEVLLALFKEHQGAIVHGVESTHRTIRFLAQRMGAEPFLPLLKTEEEWELCERVLGKDAFLDYVDQVPESRITGLSTHVFDL